MALQNCPIPGFSTANCGFQRRFDARTVKVPSPRTPHVWEGKAVNEKKFANFKKAKAQYGEKGALEQWDYVYWCQAQAYMGYFDLTRHYITVCTPGVRDWDSTRTEFDADAFMKIKDKAERILNSAVPLAK